MSLLWHWIAFGLNPGSALSYEPFENLIAQEAAAF
jgi:hypothetical protein